MVLTESRISVMKAWGQIIIDARGARGWSQDDLARAAGISRASVQNAEAATDINEVGMKVRRKLAAALSMTYEQLSEGFTLKPPVRRRREIELLAKGMRKIEREGASPEYVRSLNPEIVHHGGNPPAELVDNDIPILATSPAGLMSKPKQLGQIIGTVPRSLYPDDPQAFAIVVQGDSMTPWVNSGDVVIASGAIAFRPEGFPSGTACVVCERSHGAEHCDTIKYVYTDGSGRLRLVPRNDAYPPTERSCEDVSCYPIVVRIFRDFLRLNMSPGVPGAVVQRRHAIGEAPQEFPDYDGPSESSVHPKE